jgi:ATP-binding cassette subfamily B multidrug efflux pump
MGATGSAFDFSLLSRVLGYARPYKSTLFFTALLTILLAVIAPARPFLISYTIDKYIIVGDYPGLVQMIIALILLMVLETGLSFLYSYYSSWLGQTVIKDLRSHVFRHITRLRLKFFDNTPIGMLVTRVISDIETIADIFSEGLLVIIADILKLVVIVGVMFYVNWQLALISLSVIPIMLISTRIFQNAVKKAFQDVRTKVAELNSFVQEHITGMGIVQIFGREEQEFEKFETINRDHRDANNRSVWHYSVFLPIVEVLSAASKGLLVWIGARLALGGDVTPGEIVAYMMYVDLLFRPIRELADKFNTLQMGIVSSERVFKVLDTNDIIENTHKHTTDTIKGDISFKDVWFAYNDEDWVLKGVSFDVKAGQTIAIVGATGAGKTSVISLLGRFYEYNKGSISIDGVDLRDYDTVVLRKHVGIVLQDVFLFSDSIANNITIGKDNVTKEQLQDAARMIGAERFINNLPGDFDYNVMERGAVLSVGQRQLISFMRAYIHNPSILILDEATSSVDTESELMIQEALSKLTQGRTSIVIAHRLATVQKADYILVFDHGQIIEHGTHQGLLGQNGQYKRLFELQFKNNENANR